MKKFNFNKLILKVKEYLPFFPFLLLSFFYLLKVPIGQTPDEPAHLNYITYVAKFAALPSYVFSEVACHPPFYYLILTPFFILFKNIYVLRFVSVVFTFINLIVIKKIISIIFFKDKNQNVLSNGTAIFCSLVPMYNFMSAAVNNDSLAYLLGSLLIYYSLLSFNQKLKKNEFLVWSLVFCASILTKVILWPAALICGITVLLTQKENRKKTIFVFLFSFIILCFWFYHNISLYGNWDLLGWKKLREIQFFLTENKMIINDPRGWLVILFHSFWGIFGWFSIYLPLVVYSILRKATVILFLPFIIFILNFIKTHGKKEKLSLLLFFSFFVLTFLALVRDNLNFFHPQGRYLFSVISIIGFFYTAGFYQVSKYISQILFKSYKSAVFYFLLMFPLLTINLISALTINNFFK